MAVHDTLEDHSAESPTISPTCSSLIPPSPLFSPPSPSASLQEVCTRPHIPLFPITLLTSPHAYSPNDLTHLVRSQNPRHRLNTLTPIQSAAFARYWSSPLSLLQNFQTQRTDPLVVLKHYFSVVDALFFAGALKHHVLLTYTVGPKELTANGTTRSTKNKGEVIVELYAPPRKVLGSSYHALKGDVDMLLREMCKSFVMVWACDECLSDGPTFERAWKEIAVVIEGNTWEDSRWRGLNASVVTLEGLEGDSDVGLRKLEPVVKARWTGVGAEDDDDGEEVTLLGGHYEEWRARIEAVRRARKQREKMAGGERLQKPFIIVFDTAPQNEKVKPVRKNRSCWGQFMWCCGR